MSYDQSEEEHVHGPTGPNETWVAGDHYQTGFDCIKLTAEQAKMINDKQAEHKAKVMAAEFTRLDFAPIRTCPKCKVYFPAIIEYCWENAHCASHHGASEHFDRTCRNCNYTWAESLP